MTANPGDTSLFLESNVENKNVRITELQQRKLPLRDFDTNNYHLTFHLLTEKSQLTLT